MLARKLDRLFLRYRDADDGRALARVFDLVATDLYRFALHLSRDAEEAEELVQCAFLAAIERRDAYEARGRFFSWIAGILANERRRRLRSASREIDPARLRSRVETEASDAAADREFSARLGEALAGIPEPYRGVLDLKLTEDLEAAAIARRLGRSEGTVRAQIHRGLDLLRKILPAGLASLVVTAMPRHALARVRDATLSSAGFASATGTVGLATVEVSAGIGLVLTAAAAVYFGLPGGDERGELDRSVGTAQAEPVRRAAEPAPPATHTTVTGSSEKRPNPRAEDDPQPGGWQLSLPGIAARLPDGSLLSTGELRFAEHRGAVTPLDRPRGRSRSPLPSGLIARLAFGPLERLPGPGGRMDFEAGPGGLVAQVFLDGLDFGFLVPLRLERRERGRGAGTARPRIFEGFSLASGAEAPGDEQVTAILQTREGLERRSLDREDWGWSLAERLPLPLELEIRGGDRPPLRLLAWKEKVKLPDLDPKKNEPLPLVRLVEAFSGRRLSGLAPSLDLVADPSMSIELTELGDGLYRLPPVSSSLLRRCNLQLEGSGWLTPSPSLRKIRPRRGDEVIEFALLAAFTSPARLLEFDGRPASGARIRVYQVAQRVLLEAMSDEVGSFRLNAVGNGIDRLDADLLDAPLTITVQTFDGRHARLEGRSLRDLASGPDLRLEAGRPFVDVVLLDHEGRPVQGANLRLSVPDPDDSEAWPVGSDHGQTDEAGRCRLHGVCGDRVEIQVDAAGRLTESRILEIPDDAQLEYRLLPAAPITIDFEKPPGLELSLGRQSRIDVTEEGSHSPSAHRGGIVLDAEDRGVVLAPLGKQYRVKIELNWGRRPDGLSLRVPRPELTGVVAGSRLVVPILAGKMRKFAVLGADRQPARSALVFVPDDPIEPVAPWEQRNHGFGGSWQPGYSVSLPLGSASIVILAAGHRPARVTVRNAPDSTATVELRLDPGVVISGTAEGGEARSGRVVALELIEVRGLALPESWFEAHNRSARTWFRIEADGSFRSPPLVPGRYRLSEHGRPIGEVEIPWDIDGLVLGRPAE